MNNIKKSEIEIKAGRYITIKELMSITNKSYNVCWKITRQINKELEKNGKITFAGQTPRKYTLEKLGIGGE